jgi:hypothetical protein
VIDCQEMPGVQWDDCLGEFRDAVHEQSFAYGVARWGARRVRCVAVRRDGALVGGAMAVVARLPVIERGLAVIKFGPLYRRAGNGVEEARMVATALKMFFCKQHRLHLSILPQAPLGDDALPSVLEEAEFRPGAMISDPRRYFIDLLRGEEEMREGLAKWWRRNLKAAGKHRLHVNELEPGTGLPIFRKLFDDLKQRKQDVDTKGLEEMTTLAHSPQARHRPRVLLAQTHDDRPVAGAVITAIGERAYYAFGAQDAEGAKMNANYALQWAIVDRLRREGRCRWYDLGGDGNVAGLIQFKTGFVGKTGLIAKVPPRQEYSESSLSGLMAKAILALKGG